jgi:hypothetical protein
MQASRSTSFFPKAAALALGLAGLAATGAAHARDNVHWSVGINAAPGVVVGVGNTRPVIVQQPVYVQPQPVYVQPQPVYVQPQTIYSVPPVQYTQPQVIYPAGAFVQPVVVQRVPIYRGGHHHGHGHGRGHDRHGH